jgi:hypothetical protein
MRGHPAHHGRMDVLGAHAALTLRATPVIRQMLRRVAAGRPMRIGFASTCVRGWSMGDLTVDFGVDRLHASDLEVTPVDDVPVAIDQQLIAVLRRGATIRLRRGLSGSTFAIDLDHPEDWLAFLDGRAIGAT